MGRDRSPIGCEIGRADWLAAGQSAEAVRSLDRGELPRFDANGAPTIAGPMLRSAKDARPLDLKRFDREAQETPGTQSERRRGVSNREGTRYGSKPRNHVIERGKKKRAGSNLRQ